MYETTTHFCVLILYAKILLSSCISSSCLFVDAFQNFRQSCQSCHLQTKFYFLIFYLNVFYFSLKPFFLILFFVLSDSNTWTCGMNLTPGCNLFMNWLKHTVFLTLQFVYIFLCKTLSFPWHKFIVMNQLVSWATGLNHYVNIYMVNNIIDQTAMNLKSPIISSLW